MNFTLIALLQSAVIETVSVLLPMKFVLPNGPQAELLTGIEVCDLASAQNAARVLRSKGCEAVIITLGEKGSVLTTAEHAGHHIPAPAVKAVDTTVSIASVCVCVCVCVCVFLGKVDLHFSCMQYPTTDHSHKQGMSLVRVSPLAEWYVSSCRSTETTTDKCMVISLDEH